MKSCGAIGAIDIGKRLREEDVFLDGKIDAKAAEVYVNEGVKADEEMWCERC